MLLLPVTQCNSNIGHKCTIQAVSLRLFSGMYLGIVKKELRCVENFKYLKKKPVEG